MERNIKVHTETLLKSFLDTIRFAMKIIVLTYCHYVSIYAFMSCLLSSIHFKLLTIAWSLRFRRGRCRRRNCYPPRRTGGQPARPTPLAGRGRRPQRRVTGAAEDQHPPRGAQDWPVLRSRSRHLPLTQHRGGRRMLYSFS